jgi:hypothetical protein
MVEAKRERERASAHLGHILAHDVVPGDFYFGISRFSAQSHAVSPMHSVMRVT